jgi:hypothetical protein
MEVGREWVIDPQAPNLARLVTFDALVGPGEGRTLLDLGAGPCLFARRAQKAGWKVTAVDGRTDRLPEDLEGVTFVEADVREYDPSGFDLILNLGLLYHLTIEAQEELLRKCSYTKVILETQVHTPGVVPPLAEPWGHDTVSLRRGRKGFELWPPERIRSQEWGNALGQELIRRFPRLDGYTGLLYPEKDTVQASIGNATSFWPTEDSLLRMVERCGYRSARVIEPPIYSIHGTRRFLVLNDDVSGT